MCSYSSNWATHLHIFVEQCRWLFMFARKLVRLTASLHLVKRIYFNRRFLNSTHFLVCGAALVQVQVPVPVRVPVLAAKQSRAKERVETGTGAGAGQDTGVYGTSILYSYYSSFARALSPYSYCERCHSPFANNRRNFIAALRFHFYRARYTGTGNWQGGV